MKRIVKRKGLTKEQLDEERQRLLEAEEKRLGELPFGRMLRCRVRYFTAAAEGWGAQDAWQGGGRDGCLVERAGPAGGDCVNHIQP
jgi:hypothetical protein